MNLQIGASVRRREEPSPSSPGRRCCLGRPWSRLLNVSGRQISGNPTSVARGDIRAAAGSADKSWGRLFFLVVIINNSDKSAPLGRSSVRGGPLAHYGTCSCWHCLYCRWLSSHWPLAGHPVIGGRRWTAPLLVTAGVLVTSSSVDRWRIRPGRRLHTGRQGHVHYCSVHVSNLQQNVQQVISIRMSRLWNILNRLQLPWELADPAYRHAFGCRFLRSCCRPS